MKALLILIIFMSVQVQAGQTVIHAGEVLLIPGQQPQSNKTLVIEGKTIVKVMDGFTHPVDFDGKIIDLKDKFVMPGLMDMHVHLQGELGPNNDKDALKMSDPLMGMRTVHHGMKTLLAGFTTVRDVGSNSQYMYAYRDYACLALPC